MFNEVAMIDIDMTAIDILRHPKSCFLKYHNLTTTLAENLIERDKYGVLVPDGSEYFEKIDYSELSLSSWFVDKFYWEVLNKNITPIIITKAPDHYPNTKSKKRDVLNLFHKHWGIIPEYYSVNKDGEKTKILVDNRLNVVKVFEDNPHELKYLVKHYVSNTDYYFDPTLVWASHIESVLKGAKARYNE